MTFEIKETEEGVASYSVFSKQLYIYKKNDTTSIKKSSNKLTISVKPIHGAH